MHFLLNVYSLQVVGTATHNARIYIIVIYWEWDTKRQFQKKLRFVCADTPIIAVPSCTSKGSNF